MVVWGTTIATAVTRSSDGTSAVVELACMSLAETGCAETITIELPPTPGGRPPDVLGTGAYTLSESGRQTVNVALSDAGRAAFAGRSAPLAVRIRENPPGTPRTHIDPGFGWQFRPLL